MAESNGAAEAQPITKESLFPPGWEERLINEDEQPEAAGQQADDETLVEAQSEDTESETSAEAQLGRMKLNEFLDAAGVTMEEFYRDVYVDVNGKEVSVSEAWDQHKKLDETLQALSRERNELQERLSQSATQAPAMQDHSPEALAMLELAEQWEQTLLTADWSQLDSASATAQKFDLKLAIDNHRQKAQQKENEYQAKRHAKFINDREACDRHVRSKLPAWSEPTAKARDEQQMHETARTLGYSRQEVESWADPRAILMLHELTQLKMRDAQIQKGAKRIRKVGKTLGVGARGAQTDGKGSLRDVAKEIRNTTDPHEKRKIRLERDLGPLK